MSFLSRLAETRERHIKAHAQPYLEEGEEIIQWARAKRAEGRGEGFFYLTSRGCIIHWTNRSEGSAAVAWGGIDAWEVEHAKDGEPVLTMECDGERHAVRLRVGTDGMAQHVTDVLARFSVMAPEPPSDLDDPVPPGELQLSAPKKSIGAHTKRVIVTVVGVLLIIIGIVMTPLPGPWSLPIIIAGLAILGSEYDWAKDALDWVKIKSKQVAARIKSRRAT